MTVLNSTSVLLKWEPVPPASQNGIIIRYTIHFRDVEEKENGSMSVKAPAVNATVNGLRQKAEYLFWIVAATSVGDGPSSVSKTATTKGKGHYKATPRSLKVITLFDFETKSFYCLFFEFTTRK